MMEKRTVKLRGATFFCSRGYICRELRKRGIAPSLIERNAHDPTRLVYIYTITPDLLGALSEVDGNTYVYVDK